MTRSSLVRVRSLARSYGESPADVTALGGVDLDVHGGQVLAVMGPSGSGKTTLLSIIGGLESPTSGTVDFDGRDMWALSVTERAEVRRRHIGYVFQDFNLLSSLTAAENVGAPLELDGVSAKTARTQAIEQLGHVGLADRADSFPDDLSGGERQRVAIARGLAGDRSLVLADEPTGALDSATGAEILTLLRRACTPDTAVIIVTHDPEVADRAGRIVSLRDGLVVSDTAREGRRSSVGTQR